MVIGTIFWGIIGMGCMLFSGKDQVMKLMECTFKISWKGYFYCAIMVVPCHRETTVLGTGPISGDFVLSENHRHEVVGVFFYFLFDAKVVNDKAERYGVSFLCEKTRGVLGLIVSCGGNVIYEVLIS